MQTDTDNTRNQVDLEFLQTSLDKHGIKGQLFQLPEPDNLHFLVANMDNNCVLQLMYVPIGGILSETNLLQLFGTYDSVLERSSEVESLIALLNTKSPLGQFGLTDENKFYHRYIYSLPRFIVPNESVFIEVVDLFRNSLTTYAEIIDKLASKQFTLQEAISAL